MLLRKVLAATGPDRHPAHLPRRRDGGLGRHRHEPRQDAELGHHRSRSGCPGRRSPGIAVAYEPLAARLRADGHRTFVYELPGLGLGDIVASAEALRGYVAQVRATTGAAKVDIVGHSEGGIVSRYYLKYLGGTAEVERYLSLGSPHYGTFWRTSPSSSAWATASGCSPAGR